ncbi:MAG: c-type cytochrome [Rhodothermaceae bacterium]|nr:c-type cytochrome [Rhodothermaceae bacterium]MXZ58048.1 c-type cytochrome [Rhodothermaceae bacterium]MYB90185.1 c-type cytochrome [Rhodothermaceae bacterium]MYD67221.1 c-type cytochrome [Rhodothermaceae bacterium]MYG43676.1 c-type cytochrome [Rhodothermaceae bacterium]
MRYLLPLLLIGFAPPALAQQENDLGTEAQRAEGKEIYDIKCAHCHGYEGDANAVATPYLRPTPRDFTSGNYKFRSTESGELPTTEDIKRSIRLGMPYTSMPPWEGILSESEITNLAYYLKTFEPAFDGPYGNPTVVEIPRAPSYSEDPDHLARGREIFEANQCTDCHGVNGRGNGHSAPELVDDWGFPIRPADMTKRWTYRASATREEVYRTFMTGLNGTPMPSYLQTISDEEDRWALVDYVWSLSRDTPEYGTVVSVQGQTGELELGDELFADASEAYFPIVGQVIEPGRAFYPGVNGISVKAVYNVSEIAIQLQWHDMTAEAEGMNHPAIEVPMFDPMQPDTLVEGWSDAVAVLLPSRTPEGLERPYFMFGDSRFPMAIWYTDLATDSAAVLTGQGAGRITDNGIELERTAEYEDGVWSVRLKGSRTLGNYIMQESSFVPISFTAWDGFNAERGNMRGLSAWYHLYLEPIETESAALPMAKWFLIVLAAEIIIVGLVRLRTRRRKQT